MPACGVEIAHDPVISLLGTQLPLVAKASIGIP